MKEILKRNILNPREEKTFSWKRILILFAVFLLLFLIILFINGAMIYHGKKI